MTFAPKPDISKGEINRAGRALTQLKPGTDSYKQAIKIVNDWRTCHAYPLNTFKTTLRRKVRRYRGSLVAQRLKRLPTIVDKLVRFPEMNLSQMQDIGGLRAVLANLRHVRKLQREYKQGGRFTHELIKENDYISNPKKDGYRGVHLVYRYDNKLARNGLADQYKGLAVELQIRTQLQHVWATAVETVGTLKGESFKTGSGGKDWKDFFALISSAFAIVENTPVLPQHAEMSPREIYQKIKQHEADYGLLEKVTGLTAVAKFMDRTQGDGGYYNIISLDIKNKEASIKSFSQKQLDEAAKVYSELEANADPGIDVVLVSVGDLKSLKAAYPNYFLDMREFVEKVQVIIAETE